ncbi:MAG: ABC transporter ATP-binding protein/permease [Treponema sp.]|jgi:ATP-binding cassette subfamily B protein|nr:ABC transporter ATP-binding protein/permease [Treponema sp.]
MEKMNLKKYIAAHRVSYIIAFTAMLLSVSLDMLSPQLIRHIIDDVIIGGKQELLAAFLFGILGIGIGRCVFQYTKEYLFDVTGSEIAGELRRDLFRKIQSLSADFFDRVNSGELMSRVKDDIDRIWDGLTYIGMLTIEVIVHTIIVLYCMYSLSWKLAVLPTAGMLAAAVVAIIMEKKLGTVYEDIAQENSVLNNTAAENLAGVRTVKAFAREKFEIGKFFGHNRHYYDLNLRQSRIFVAYYPFLQSITHLLPFLVMLPGGYMVIKKTMTLGELTAFVQYSMNIVWPMEMLGWLTNGISSARASAKRIQKIYAEVPQIAEDRFPVRLPAVKGEIEFSHVSFAGDHIHDILHDISFHVQAGSTIGIMGATGAGKTTVINLLKRMYDATGGVIKLDGVDIRKLGLSQLRTSIACVMQDVFLFSDTISDNVKLGRKNRLNMCAVKKAVQSAHADDFVEKMEAQYNTVIGERGVGLSGGQKQRLTIARALSSTAPVLVFDDSTSALDTETEQHIQQTLEKLQGVTKIIIAHRISAVRTADEIIVLDKGSVAERGTHDQLLAKKGLYYTTYQTQYGACLREHHHGR